MLPRRRSARIVSSPTRFDGTFDELATRYVVPNLPLPDAVEQFHRQLVAYCDEPSAVFLVRQVGDTERGRDYLTGGGDRFRAVDNAPAWAVHYALFHEVDLQGEPFSRFVDGLPVHMFDVTRVLDASINTAGWHVAHIYEVGDRDTDFRHWTRAQLVRRFIRNIHTCNHFFVPLANWQRYGGDERVIAYFAHLYAARYATIWPEFCALAHAIPTPYHSSFGQLRYSLTSTASAPATGTAPLVPPIGSPSRRSSITTSLTEPLVTYRHTRLCFRADQIEPLPMDGSFRVTTNVGIFQMTKAEFYRDFANVVQTRSYRAQGGYHYSVLPRRAERYRVN
jgi:hypothetical protein